MGLSWGAVVGLDVTDYVIILNTVEAVHAFAGSGQLTIGAGLEVGRIEHIMICTLMA